MQETEAKSFAKQTATAESKQLISTKPEQSAKAAKGKELENEYQNKGNR